MATNKKPAGRQISSWEDLDSAGIGIGYRPMSFQEQSQPVEAEPQERSMLRAAGDLGLQVAGGAVSGVRMMTDLAGADNAVSTGLRSAEDALRELQSAAAKADQQRIAEIMKEAENKGFGEQVVAGVRAFGQAPAAMVAQAIGTSLPTLATALIPGVGQGAMAARLAAGAGIGAAQGAGNIKGVIYDEVMQNPLPGETPEQTKARAQNAQAYSGPNTGQILLGGGLGGLAGSTGMERTLAGLRNGVTQAAPGLASRVGMAAAAEAVPEIAQGGQEKMAGNLALRNEGFDVDPMAGVAASATMEGLAGGITGGLAGIPNPPVQAKEPVPQPVQPPQPLPETGPMTRAVNAGLGPRITNTLTADLLGRSADPLAGQITAERQAAEDSALMRNQFADRNAASLAGGGLDGSRADPLANMLAEARATDANAFTNVQQVANSRPPMPASDAARILDEAKARGMDMTAAPHPDGGFVVVPRQWVTPDMAAQAETEIADTLARMQQADAAPVERAERRRSEPVDLNLNTDPVAGYIEDLRKTNTPAARAYVGEFDAGRITRADVEQRMQADRGLTPDERLARAAAEGLAYNAKGDPFKTLVAANLAAKTTPGTVIEVPGGYAIRTRSSSYADTQAQDAAPAEASVEPAGNAGNAGNAAPAVRSAGVPGVDQPQPLDALTDEQDAPQATTGAPVTTGAATTGAEAPTKTRQKPDIGATPVEAPAPARGDGAAAAGVPAAGAGAGVRADGVGKEQFDPKGLKPGTAEYEAAFEKWISDQSDKKLEINRARQRQENTAAVQKRNGWRSKIREWFLGAKDGDTITDTGTGQSYKVIERTRKDGTKIKTLAAVDENGAPLGDGRAATGIAQVGNRVEGLDDGGIDDDTGSATPETAGQSLASSLGKLLEDGDAKTATPGATDVQADGVKEQPPIDPLGWSAKKMADAYDMEQMNQLHQYVLRNYSNPVIGGGPVENGRATTERFNAEGRKIHAAMQKAMQAIYDRKKAATDVSKNTPKVNTSAEPAQKTAESEQVEPFEHAGLKLRPSRVKEGDQVVDRWVVQSPENAEREARGERQIGGDRIVETREQAIKTAEQEVKRYAKEKSDRAEIDAQDKARRDAEEAKKEANRGKTLLERRADAILDKPGKFPASAGLGLGTKREAMDKAIEQGRLVTEVMVDDTAAKKRDQDAVDAVRRAGYILGASNENIPVVKRGLEAQARLKEGKYQKPEYRVYQGSDRNGSFFEITKTEYDYVQKVKENPPTESKPDQETKAKAEPKAENLPEGWDTLKNGYTGLPVYRFNQGAGQPFAVVTRTEAGYEVQIRHGDKLVTSRNMRGYATGEALDIATQMLGEATMATHKDPGEKAEPATKAVVNEAMKTAAKNEDTKPSEMRKWLLGEIDKALLQAPDRADYDEAVKRMGEKDAVSMFTGNGFLGKNAETGFVTFDVPGDGKFKVRNSTRGLLEFRKNVSASLGFKDSGQKTVKPDQNEGVRNGSGGQMAAITNMIEEGDFEAARDYAEAVGIKLEDVKVPRGDRKPQWDQFLKDGTVPPPPDTRPLPPQRTPAQIAEDERLAKEAEAKKPKDTGWNMAGTGYGGKRYRGRNITTADGREIVARIYENAGNYDEVEVKVDGVRKFTVRDSYNAQDKADAFVKTLIEGEKPKADGVGRAVAGGQEGVNGYFYKGGQFLPSTMAEPGKWKVDGKWVKSGRALIGPREYGYQPTPFSRSLFELAGVGQFTQVTWDGRLAIQDGVRTNQGEPVTGDMTIRPGVKGVLGKEELTLQEIVDAWNNGQRWFDVKPDAETVTTQDDEPAIPEGYKPAGEPFYRGGKLTQGYAPFAPGERVTMKDAAGQSGVVESFASPDDAGVFASAVVKFDNGVEQMVQLGKLQAAAAPAQTQATGTRRDPAKVSMFNPYEDGDIVTIDGQDWTVKQDTPGWYLTNTGNWRGTHPTIRNIKAMADLIRAVEQAAVAQPKAAEPEPETTRLTPAEAAELMEWQSLGTKDGVTKHILTFYESKANKDAKRGRMIVATVTKGDRSATAWMVDGDDQTFGPLSLAKKRGMEIGMAKAVSDGFVDAAPAQQEAQQAGEFNAQAAWDAMTPAARGAMLDKWAGAGQTDMGERYKSRAWGSFNAGEKGTLAAVLKAAQEPATDDRDTFTLKRLNRETGRMEPVTFKRGEYVEVTLIGSDKKDYGEIDGISQARREFSVNGLWHTMAAAYKAERPAAPVRKDMAPLSSVIDKMNAKNGEGLTDADRVPEQKPASKTPTVDRYNDMMKAVREGKATAEQFKAAFESLVANKDAVLAELDTKTKAELLKAGGYYFQMRNASEKKGDVIDAMYRQMVSGFVLGDTLSYGMGKGAFEAAVRRHVEATDDAKLEQYAKDRKAAMEAAQAERAAKAAAMENPQTLADFKAIIAKHIGEGKSARDAFLALTPEQRIKYDTLAAESTKDEREARKRAAKTEVRAAGQATGGEIIATKHTRDGYDLFVVKLADRLSKEDYNTVLASAKRLGGWYSSFRGNGAIPGFQFKDKANAEAFLKLAGGDTADAQAQAEQRRDAFEDDRSQTAAERLRTMADKLTEQAAEIENAERKTNTARRARFAASALNGAAEMKAKASTMRNIAQALEDGNAKFLDAVRTKSQVDMLTSIVATAKSNELRAKYPSYADQEKRKGEPATAETADFAEFPVYTAFRSDLATLGRQMLEVDGAKKLGQRLMSVADDVSDAYLEFAKQPGNLFKLSTFSIKRGDEVKAAIFPSREQAETAIKRSGLTGKAIVLAEKRGVNRIIMSPSEAINAGIWTGDGDKRITLSADFGAELVEAIGRRGNKANKLTVPWQFQNTYDRRKALSRMGIETASEYRSALREFIGLQERAIANKVREMELQMVGRKADGLDFFPTPAEIADQMIEAAEITPDMAVLEPSAGMGHIADRIREAGAEPDVIEISPERRELLQEKGYHLAETDDFMAMQPRKFFTYGDVFRAPDGTEGVMQGSGGMGSRRVVLKPLIDGVEVDYKRGQWYDRDELVGVRHRGSWSGYDRIIMNPPFSNRRDAEHVMHAYTLLKPGGRIVAIMGEGVFFGQDKKAQEFRDWLESVGGTSEKLPPGSFMDPSLPVNTGVSARMVVIDKPAGNQTAGDVPAFSRSTANPAGISKKTAADVVDAIRSRWANAPEVVVVSGMQDQAVPQRVRDADLEQRSMGATGEPEGFWYGGKVYIVAGALKSPRDVIRVLFHESLGHYGLQGVFGDGLKPILQQIAALRRAEVVAKAREYGLVRLNADGSPSVDVDNATDKEVWAAMDEQHKLYAAEEVLAVMAQTKPEMGYVKRALAAIRAWLRKNVPGFQDMKLTDGEIIQQYILPARRFVESGPGGGPRGGQPVPALSRTQDQTQTPAFKKWFGDSKVVDANGKPLVVYHGTKSDFNIFDAGEAGKNTSGGMDGFFFTDSSSAASSYATYDTKRADALESAERRLTEIYDEIDSASDARDDLDGLSEDEQVDKFLDEFYSESQSNPKNGSRKSIYDEQARLEKLVAELSKPASKNDIMDGASVYPAFVSLQNPLVIDFKRSGKGSVGIGYVDRLYSEIEKAKAGGHDGVIAKNTFDSPDIQDAHTVYIAFRPEQIKSATGNRGTFDPDNADIRFSRTSDIKKAIPAFDVKTAPKNSWAHYRGKAMQALGRRQIVDLYAEELPQLAQYDYLVQQMDAEKNDSGAEADKLAQDWGKLRDEKQLAELMHDATLAQIDPAKPMETGVLQAQYRELKERFDALTPEAQALYRQARDMYDGHYRKVQKAIKERIERSEMSAGQKRQIMAKMDEELFKKLKGVYFPLARFGQYVIVVKDANGEVKNVTRAESINEAEEARKELHKAFPKHMGYTVGKVLKQAEFNAGRDAVGKGFMADLMDALDANGIDDELRDTVAQLYLSSLPDLSWAKHGIHRKGTPGFSQDARRAFAQNMFHGARYLAKLRYADQLQDELIAMQDHVKAYEGVEEYDSIQAQQVVDEMVKRHEIMMNPNSSPVSTALTSLGFVFHLGLSPASAMVNLSQTALVAYPMMGAKWGWGKASAALLAASQDVVKAKNDLGTILKGEELAAYERAVRDGTIDVTMAHDLAGISQGEDQKVMWRIRPVMRAASFMFHHAERFNRQATFIAAWRMAKEAGPDKTADQLYEEAKKLTYDSHFDYSASNRPRVMQGNWQRVIFLFKQYSQAMVYTLSRNAYLSMKGASPADRALARKTLGGILATHAAAAGVLGLPLVGPLLTAASFIGSDDDEPWDAEVAMQNVMADMVGPKAAEVMARGFSRLTPFDLSGRVALNKLILPDVQEGLEGQRWAESLATASLGPVAGIGVNMARGLQKITEGNYMMGLEDMMPSALRGPLRAMRYASEGAVDKTGVVITDEVGPGSIAGQALGFSPSEVRRATERKAAIMDYDRSLADRRSALVRQWAEAQMAGDTDGVKDVMAEIQGFNKKNPNRKITMPHLIQSVRARRRRIDQAEDGVYLPKNRDSAREAVRF